MFAAVLVADRSMQKSQPQIYYIAADIFPSNKCGDGTRRTPAAQWNCLVPTLSNEAISQRSSGPCRHGAVILIASIPSGVPLLDTPKDVHIWYTRITTHGWFVFEFNYSGLVIRQMETD